jgi:hypothetical protein
MKTRIAANVGVVDASATSGSLRYPATVTPFSVPVSYCARITGGSPSPMSGRMARKTLTFSSRTESPVKELGGSIAAKERSWSRWFWNMSRRTPDSS